MPQRSKTAVDALAAYPPLPFDTEQWQAVVNAMGISKQQAKVVELVLRDLGVKEIAAFLGLGEGTVKDYLKRIGSRTGTRGRMQLAMYVMTLSLRVNSNGQCRTKG
jgi:DNA-binding NarL/FixJ family response regulator